MAEGVVSPPRADGAALLRASLAMSVGAWALCLPKAWACYAAAAAHVAVDSEGGAIAGTLGAMLYLGYAVVLQGVAVLLAVASLDDPAVAAHEKGRHAVATYLPLLSIAALVLALVVW